MLYIIDKENFEGTIEASMPDGIRTEHTRMTLEEFRNMKNNPRLITVTPEEFELMRDKYIQTLTTALVEINEDEYFSAFRRRKLYTGTLDKGYGCFFFGEYTAFGIYDCFCDVNGRYYTAKKSIGITRKEIEDEVIRLDAQGKDNTERVAVIEYNDAPGNAALVNYLEKYNIFDIGDLFDSDTCKIRIRGYDYPFIKIEEGANEFIVYSDVEYDIERKGLETILFLFFSDGFEGHFTKKDPVWSDYGEGCIAFKQWGQSTFAIWQYNGQLPKERTD